MKLNFSLMIALCAALLGGLATAASPYAAMAPVPLRDVRLTDGFWAERQAVNNEVSLKVLWDRANDPEAGHVIQNFEIAAGRREGVMGGNEKEGAGVVGR